MKYFAAVLLLAVAANASMSPCKPGIVSCAYKNGRVTVTKVAHKFGAQNTFSCSHDKSANQCSCDCSTALAAKNQHYKVTLVAITGTGTYADSGTGVDAQFLVNGKWTARSNFFKGKVNKGDMVQKEFDLQANPSKVKLFSNGNDGWMMTYFAIDKCGTKHTIARYKNTVGFSYHSKTKNQWWLDGDSHQAKTQTHNIDINALNNSPCYVTPAPTPAPTPQVTSVTLTAHTNNQGWAATGGVINAQFFVNGAWTTQKQFFKGAAKLSVKAMKFETYGNPTKVKLINTSNDGWGHWKLELSRCSVKQVIVQDSKGSTGSAYGNNQWWIDGDQHAPPTNTYNIDVSQLVNVKC